MKLTKEMLYQIRIGDAIDDYKFYLYIDGELYSELYSTFNWCYEIFWYLGTELGVNLDGCTYESAMHHKLVSEGVRVTVKNV